MHNTVGTTTDSQGEYESLLTLISYSKWNNKNKCSSNSVFRIQRMGKSEYKLMKMIFDESVSEVVAHSSVGNHEYILLIFFVELGDIGVNIAVILLVIDEEIMKYSSC